MGVFLPNGSTIAIAGTLAAEKTVSGISNAKPAIATAPAHGFANGDIVLLRSGWTSLNDRVARVADQASGVFTLDGIDASSTRRFPPGGGGGGARAVPAAGWTEITQILESSSSGGDQQFVNYNFLSDTGDQRQLPTKRSPRAFTLQVADDPTLAHYPVLEAADADRLPRVIRVALANGAFIYYSAYVSFSKTPTMTQDQIMALPVTLSLASEPTRYAS